MDMATVRHEAYRVRELGFQFSLMVLGIKKFIETEDIWSKKKVIYEHYQSEFLFAIKPLLLNLAINCRAMDDEIKHDKSLNEHFNSCYQHTQMAVLLPEQIDLKLREVLNKIIHAKKFYWYSRETPCVDEFERLLGFNNEADLMVLGGEYNGKPWLVGSDLLILSEQIYEFSEVCIENCGL